MSNLITQLKTADQKVVDEALITTELTIKRRMKGLRATIVGAFALSLAAIIAAGFLYQSLNSEKRQRQVSEAEQEKLNSDSQQLNDKVAKYETVIGGLREQITEYSQERRDFKKEIERNNIEIENLRKKMLALEDQKRKLTSQAARASRKAEESAAAAAVAVVPVVAEEPVVVEELVEEGPIEVEIPEATKEEAEAVSKVKTQAPKIPGGPAVLSVNKKYRFAVVNIGRREGVKIGDQFEVLRNENVIGSLEVEKLYDHFVAAKIVKEEDSSEIRQGDSIRKVS